MAAQASEIYRRPIRLTSFAPPNGQNSRTSSTSTNGCRNQPGPAELPNGGHRVLPGTDRHEDDRAVKCLAVIATITLRTATSSVVGVNVIVNEQTLWIPMAILLASWPPCPSYR